MRKRVALGWLLVISFYVLALVWERIEVTRTGYEVTRQQREIVRKTARNQHLKFELEELKSPSRLQTLACSRLSMVPPDPRNVVMLDDIAAQETPKTWIVKIFSSEESKTN